MCSISERLALVDSHCHLDLPQFDVDRAAVIERARQAGVRWSVLPGIEPAQWANAQALAEQEADLYWAPGLHPNSADQWSAATAAQLREALTRPKVVALGEIGLDCHWKIVPPAVQQAAFEAQLALAAEAGLPVIIHCRDANVEVMKTLRGWVNGAAFRQSPLAKRPFTGVLHAFPGDLAMAEEAYAWNFVVGLGGPVTFKNAKALHTVAAGLRLDRLMLETDAPYLTPHPHRGTRNEPAYTELICRQIAALHNMAAAEVAAITTQVAVQFYRVPPVLPVTAAHPAIRQQ
jgi:TatD DNase family protein